MTVRRPSTIVGPPSFWNCRRRRLFRGRSLAHHVTILHVDRSTRRHRAQLFHTELRRDGPCALVVVVDARDYALDLGRVERPSEDQLAGTLGEPAALRVRAHRTQHLEILPVERRRSDETPDAHRDLIFDDRKETVGLLPLQVRQRPDELPYVVLLLEGAEEAIVRSVQGPKFHRSPPR